MNSTTKTEVRPLHIQIGPYQFTVKYVDKPADYLKDGSEERILAGCVRFDQLTIYIEDNTAESITADTLLHEVNHIIWVVAGGWAYEEADEERIISTLTTTQLDTFRRNPYLMKFLLGG